ncbi:MAG: DsbA family oxidoreductase [Roseomonas sp.]|nr:DsbA family oxidoreductase [Roseomonas sp.]MCA3290584.1 DsbA family oxidoreductase [Roseomonas sp.]MCA3293713.1 DsbA family oxidoreductase [Roseomonas sp.]MCA4918962.1 DsbA family oxidoreductase [Roseomonas sp.]
MDSATEANVGTLDVISDAICPWCWIGKRNLDAALDMLAEDGLHFKVRFRPFQLNPEMPPEGVDRREYRSAKFGSLEKSQELDRRVADAGRVAGLEFRHDLMARTPNTLEAHRLMRLAGADGLQREVAEAIFQAYFQEGADIGDPETLARLGAVVGLSAETLAAFNVGDAGRHEVLAEDEGYRQAGISGVPSFVLDRHLLFSGAMPPENIADGLRRAVAILRERAREAAAE